ncbi:hypothetical protein U9M48_004699 [Paspalum notatum var. saurae]|uniref:Uncharacterized protein n=1 Tax=Paspalum notatum var. saurae TaxID=547442 RepID=A0AAQ3SL02_PASNO
MIPASALSKVTSTLHFVWLQSATTVGAFGLIHFGPDAVPEEIQEPETTAAEPEPEEPTVDLYCNEDLDDGKDVDDDCRGRQTSAGGAIRGGCSGDGALATGALPPCRVEDGKVAGEASRRAAPGPGRRHRSKWRTGRRRRLRRIRPGKRSRRVGAGEASPRRVGAKEVPPL